MTLFRVAGQSLERVPETTFANEGLQERRDIQRLLKTDISVLAADLMVIAEEFGDWSDSNRRIDLLCIDKQASLVVVELKRTEDGGHMELQAIRYAAMISSMTFDQLVGAHARYLGGDDAHQAAEAAILAFLGWDTPDDGLLADTVRIMLLSANFSRELTTAVIWLNKQGLDVTCFRLKPHRLVAEVLIDVQQLRARVSAFTLKVEVVIWPLAEGQLSGCLALRTGRKPPLRGARAYLGQRSSKAPLLQEKVLVKILDEKEQATTSPRT